MIENKEVPELPAVARADTGAGHPGVGEAPRVLRGAAREDPVPRRLRRPRHERREEDPRGRAGTGSRTRSSSGTARSKADELTVRVHGGEQRQISLDQLNELIETGDRGQAVQAAQRARAAVRAPDLRRLSVGRPASWTRPIHEENLGGERMEHPGLGTPRTHRLRERRARDPRHGDHRRRSRRQRGHRLHGKSTGLHQLGTDGGPGELHLGLRAVARRQDGR